MHRAVISLLLAPFFRLAAAALLLLSFGAARAVQTTWTGSAGDGLWSTGGNWSPVPPGSGGNVVFGASDSITISLGDPVDGGLQTGVASLTFDADAPAYTITVLPGYNGLQLNSAYGGAGVVNNSAFAQTIENLGGNGSSGNALWGGVTQFFGLSAGNLHIVNEGATNAGAYYGGSTIFYSGADAGTSVITNNGGVLSYQGFGYTIFYDTSSAAGSTITNNGGSTYFYDNSTAANSTITGTSGLTYFTDNSTAGSAHITGGSVQFDTNADAGSATIEAGGVFFFGHSTGGTARIILSATQESESVTRVTSLQIGGQEDGAVSVGSIEGNGGDIYLGSNTLTVGSLGTSTTYAGYFDGDNSSRLVKVGSGTLTLTGDSGSNLFTGTVTISGGALEIGDGGSIASVRGVEDNAQFIINRSTALSFSRPISGTGSLVKSGTGTLTLSGTNTYSGGTVINGGLISFTGTNRLGTGNITLDGGGLQWGTSTTTDLSGRLNAIGAGGATFNTGANNVAFGVALTGDGGITKAGSGTLTLNAANSYAGPTVVTAGVLTFGAAGTLGSATAGLVVSGGALNLAAKSFTTGTATLSGGTISNGTLSGAAYDAQSGTLSAVLSGSGAFNKTTGGTVTLSGTNTGYSGAIQISDGALRATTSASALGTGGVTLSGGALQLANNTALSFNNNITVNGDATITSDRTSSGAGVTHTLGTLSIGAQTLTITRGSLATSGTGGIAFGAATLTGSATFAPGANTLLTLASVTGTDTDFTVNGGGNLTVSGLFSLGNGGLVKSGTGTLTLNGMTSYGDTTINGGTLTLGANADLGSGSVTINGGTFTYNKAAGLGARDIAINGGTFGFTAAGGAGTGSFILNGGALQWSGANTLDVSDRLDLIGNATFDTGGNTVTFANALTTSFDLGKLGSGTLTLAAGTSIAGQVIAGAGTLRATGATIAGASSLTLGGGNLSVAADSALTTSQAFNVTASSTFTFDRASAGAAVTNTFGAATFSPGAVLTTARTGNVTSGTATLKFTGSSSYLSGASPSFSLGAGTEVVFDSLNAAGAGLTINGSGNLSILGTLSNVLQVAMNSPGTLTLSGTANTYTGRTNINNGTVVVTKLADLGQPSSLGAPTTAANGAIWLGFTSVGTLRYIGDTDSSTNRSIELAGNNGVGSAVDSSGAGTVTFTSPVIIISATGNRTLTLTGTNAGLNTISGAIPNPTTSGATSLAKTGAGMWVLSGSNTYSGGTTLSAGTLVAGSNNALGTGALSLSGGTLQGDGTARTLANAITLAANSTLGGASDLTFTGTLTNSGGNRTLTLSNTGLTTLGSVNLSEGSIGRTLTLAGAGNATISGVIANRASGASNPGNLVMASTGTLTLAGNNTYTGRTTIQAGVLKAAHNNALGNGEVVVGGGVFFVDNGVQVANDITLSGGSYQRSLSGDLANAVNATSALGGVNTTAQILSGTSGLTTLITSFSADSGAFNDEIRLSDVYSFAGTGSNVFVLELSFTSTKPDAFLGWLNVQNQWVNAVVGNIEGTNNASAAQQGFAGSFSLFQNGDGEGFDGYGTNLSTYTGAWGVDMEGGATSVWAVLNHNSDFSAVPEPSAWLLFGLGASAFLLRRRG